jgi:mRNA interferase HigB
MPIIFLKSKVVMRIISRAKLVRFGESHSNAKAPLEEWHALVRRARWTNFDDLRRTYPSADQVRVESGNTVTVFNIGGNNYRLISAIHYNTERIYILEIFSHAEYNKINWKARF